MHDLATPYFRTRYMIEQSTVTPEARERLFFGVYPGGHIFYLQKVSRARWTLRPFLRRWSRCPSMLVVTRR